jgi:hypothetical protein
MINLPKATYDAITTFTTAEDAIREFTGYTFSNRHLLLAAFYGNSNPAFPRQRLAFLGDGLVKHNACADWYESGKPTCKTTLAWRQEP